jgi:hypothetical protein
MITSNYNNLEGTIFHIWNHRKHTLHIPPQHFTWRNLKNTSNNVAAIVVVVSYPWFLIDNSMNMVFIFVFIFCSHHITCLYNIPTSLDLCQIHKMWTSVTISKLIKLCFQLVDPSIDHTGYNGCSCFTYVQATEFHPYGIFDAGRSASICFLNKCCW